MLTKESDDIAQNEILLEVISFIVLLFLGEIDFFYNPKT